MICLRVLYWNNVLIPTLLIMTIGQYATIINLTPAPTSNRYKMRVKPSLPVRLVINRHFFLMFDTKRSFQDVYIYHVRSKGDLGRSFWDSTGRTLCTREYNSTSIPKCSAKRIAPDRHEFNLHVKTICWIHMKEYFKMWTEILRRAKHIAELR